MFKAAKLPAKKARIEQLKFDKKERVGEIERGFVVENFGKGKGNQSTHGH